MAESKNNPNNKVYNANDTLDINELAALNDDISTDFLDQLQNKIAADNAPKNDGDLFEEVAQKSDVNKPHAEFNKDIDDNFIKKYRAKLLKQQNASLETEKEEKEAARRAAEEKAAAEKAEAERLAAEKAAAEKAEAERLAAEKAEAERLAAEKEAAEKAQQEADLQQGQAEQANVSDEIKQDTQPQQQVNLPDNIPAVNNDIKTISGGNIMEHPVSQDKLDYKNSLDYLDENVKYSKYVIYIDPENKNFIDSLTVKERKNLINRIIREQDAIDITKRRFGRMQAIIKHSIVAILTILMAIPCIYWAINASLEATINNYRQSQSAFEVLYREKGKLKKIK